MQATNYSRKLEKTGRLMIPIRLREEMGMKTGKEYYFFTHEVNGQKYICIDCGSVSKTTLEEALQIVKENGIEIIQS